MKNHGAVTKKVVVFIGLIASGKSFAAGAWAEKNGFAYCNTDVVRKQLAGFKSGEPRGKLFAEGIYSPAFSRLTYDALLNYADKALEDPKISVVVLDGSYQSQAERERVLRSFEPRARVVFVLCGCREEIIKARLAQRALDPAAVSDGSWEIYLRQKEVFEYPEELSLCQFRRLDTNQPVGQLLVQLDRILQGEEEVGEESC